MTDSPNPLGWLQVGAKVAYISGQSRSETVTDGVVEKIGKRDVVVTVDGRIEKFNIGRTSLRSDDVTWLHRSGSSSYSAGVDLAPLDHPLVAKYRARQQLDKGTKLVRRWADEFQSARDVETARKLRDAIDVYLKLHEETES